jgi:hypothetical protein
MGFRPIPHALNERQTREIQAMAYRDTGYGFSVTDSPAAACGVRPLPAPVTDDQREDGRPAMGYVVATDSFLSGWGLAPGRALFAVAVGTREERAAVESNMRARSEMKRPRFVRPRKSDGRPDVRLQPGDHLSVRDRATAGRFYVPGAFERD